MTQTKEGAKKAAIKVKAKFGEDFYKQIGQKGGRNSRGGGFASNKIGKDGLTGAQRAKIAGKKGGRRSTRLGISNGQGRQANKDINEMERILEEESGRN